MAIAPCPVTERPRERLLASGPRALSDAELLAVLLIAGPLLLSPLDAWRRRAP